MVVLYLQIRRGNNPLSVDTVILTFLSDDPSKPFFRWFLEFFFFFLTSIFTKDIKS